MQKKYAIALNPVVLSLTVSDHRLLNKLNFANSSGTVCYPPCEGGMQYTYKRIPLPATQWSQQKCTDNGTSVEMSRNAHNPQGYESFDGVQGSYSRAYQNYIGYLHEWFCPFAHTAQTKQHHWLVRFLKGHDFLFEWWLVLNHILPNFISKMYAT